MCIRSKQSKQQLDAKTNQTKSFRSDVTLHRIKSQNVELLLMPVWKSITDFDIYTCINASRRFWPHFNWKKKSNQQQSVPMFSVSLPFNYTWIWTNNGEKKIRPKISIGFYDWAIKTTVAFSCLQKNSLSVFVLYSFYHFHIRLWFIPSIRLFQCQWNGIWNISIDTQTYHEDQPFNKQQQKSVNVYLGNSFFSLSVSTMMCNIYMKKLVICYIWVQRKSRIFCLLFYSSNLPKFFFI